MKRSLVVLPVLAAMLWSVPALALNPQPLPPKERQALFAKRFKWVLLNPQPLPPRFLVRRMR